MLRHATHACCVLAIAGILHGGGLSATAAEPTDSPSAERQAESTTQTETTTSQRAGKLTTPMPDVIVSASRGPRDPDTVPADVTVIGRAEIEASGATSVPELLRHAAGITITTLGNPTSADIGIRGFGQGQVGNLNTAVLIDGQRANFADLAPVDYMSIPLDQIERIEIRRGGGGAQYGNNATSGVINIVTRRAGSRSVEIGAEVDSYGYATRLALSWLEGPWSAYAQQRYEDSDGYRTNNGFRNNTSFLSLAWEPADGPFAVDLSAGLQDEYYGLPGGLNAGERAALGRRGSTDLLNHVSRESAFVNLTPSVQLTADDELSIGLGYRERLTETTFFFGVWPSPSADRQLLYTASPQWTSRRAIGGLANTFTLGLDLSVADLHAIENRTDSTQTLVAVFAHDSLELRPDVYLDLGARYADADMAFGDGFEDVSEELYAWNVGLTWNYRPDSKAYISYDRSYRLPVLDEYQVYDFILMEMVVNTDLQPQITRTLQAGVEHRFGPRLRAAASVFHIVTDDEIYFDPSSFTNRNYEETERVGFSLGLQANPCDRLALDLNYTWLDATFADDGEMPGTDGNRVPMAPEHTLNARATVDLPAGFTFMLQAQWQDSQRIINDQANTEPTLPDRWLVDARLGYQWRWLSLHVGVDNLLDERYDEAAIASSAGPAFHDYYPAAERSVSAGLSLRFTY